MTPVLGLKMTTNIIILAAVALGFSLGIFTFWFALKVLGRMKYDLENDLPILHKQEYPVDFDSTGEA